MARFPQHEARKGSQKWLQILINERPQILNLHLRQNLNLTEDEEIHWISPLRDDNYAEYRDEEFLEKLGINAKKIKLMNFWPKGGPQWDALGRSSSEKLFLVEAKSHIPELISTLKANNQISIDQILKSLAETKRRFGSKADFDWSKTFYQYTNRLAHVYLLRKNKLDAWLIDVYFLNDSDMEGPKTVDEWRGAIRLLHRCLGLRENLLQKWIADIFIDVTNLPLV